MSTDPVITALRVVPGLRGSSKRTLSRLVRLMDRASVPAGYVLTHQGRFEPEAFIVVSGTASVEIDGVAISEIGPGAIVGEMALLDGGSRTATVRAITEMDLLVIAKSTFGEFIRQEDVGPAVAEQLSGRLRVTHDRHRLHP